MFGETALGHVFFRIVFQWKRLFLWKSIVQVQLETFFSNGKLLGPMPPREIELLMSKLEAWCQGQHGRQKEAALEIGVSEQALSNWLSGRKTPSLPNFLKIQEFLKEREE